VTYLITFACYGCHLHGDQRGAVDRGHNLPGSRVLEPDEKRASYEQHLMDQPPYELDSTRRSAVLDALKEVCLHRGWRLLAAYIRTNHVHVIVEGEAPPERMMNDFKAYASRCLNRLNPEEGNRKRWARHGSTRWLWKSEQVSAALHSMVEEQGEPMALFEALVP
jgi:REP element-mobilizing transposase RayT